MADYRHIEGKDLAFVIDGDMDKVVEYIKDEYGLMTGLDWYNKYEALANSIPSDMPIGSPRLTSLQLARQAAGLEN